MPRAGTNCARPFDHNGWCRTSTTPRDIETKLRINQNKKVRYHNPEFHDQRLARIVSRMKDMRSSNPALYKKRLTIYNAKQRAKKLGIPFSLTVDSAPDIPEYCPILGIKLSMNISTNTRADDIPSLDRIIPELGYVPGNVMWISWRANRLKQDASLWELEQITKYVRTGGACATSSFEVA